MSGPRDGARTTHSQTEPTEAVKRTWFDRVAEWGANTVFGVPRGTEIRLVPNCRYCGHMVSGPLCHNCGATTGGAR